MNKNYFCNILLIVCFFILPYGCGKVNSEGATVTDIDGNVYKTVTIGTQVWMAENLKTSKYRDGSAIPTGFDSSAWSNATSGAYAIYNNDPANDITYGKLYNYYAVADSRNLCPTGWHVPSDAEWDILLNYLGGSTVAGGKMKNTTGWNAPNTGANNSSGFLCLPGGNRNNNGTFNDVGGNGYFWSSTPIGTTHAWNRNLYYADAVFYRDGNLNTNGFSVRCVKD